MKRTHIHYLIDTIDVESLFISNSIALFYVPQKLNTDRFIRVHFQKPLKVRGEVLVKVKEQWPSIIQELIFVRADVVISYYEMK